MNNTIFPLDFVNGRLHGSQTRMPMDLSEYTLNAGRRRRIINSTEKEAIMKFHSANTLFSLALDSDTLYEEQGSIPGGTQHW